MSQPFRLRMDSAVCHSVVWTWLLAVIFLSTPVADTLIEVSDSHHHAHQDSHQDKEDCPDSHNHSNCDCLCCPGHIVAISSSGASGVETRTPIKSFIPATRLTMRLPAGVQDDVYRPPQQLTAN